MLVAGVVSSLIACKPLLVSYPSVYTIVTSLGIPACTVVVDGGGASIVINTVSYNAKFGVACSYFLSGNQMC